MLIQQYEKPHIVIHNTTVGCCAIYIKSSEGKELFIFSNPHT